jgi:hypothetical protein
VAIILCIRESKISFSHYDGSWKAEFGTSNIAENNWSYLTWVNHDNGTMDLYVNGIKENSVPSLATNGLVDRLGGAWSATYSWIGLIDDVRIHNRVLSATEIKAMYDAAK